MWTSIVSDREGLRSDERDGLDVLVDKIPYFQCRRHRFHPWSGNSDPTCRLAQSGKKEAQSLPFPSPTNPKKKRRFIDEKKKKEVRRGPGKGKTQGDLSRSAVGIKQPEWVLFFSLICRALYIFWRGILLSVKTTHLNTSLQSVTVFF